MSPAPKKRSTILVLVGAAVFIIGTALAALATRGSGPDHAQAAEAVTTTTAPAGLVSAPTAPAPAPSFVIPDGHEAVAIQVPYVAGVAGYPTAGSQVNVYGVIKNQNDSNGNSKVGDVGEVLTNIQVLSVTSPAPGAADGNSTYLLSVTPQQATQLVALQSFQSAYLTLSRDTAKVGK